MPGDSEGWEAWCLSLWVTAGGTLAAAEQQQIYVCQLLNLLLFHRLIYLFCNNATHIALIYNQSLDIW